jgi:methionyl-tRNA formyltransferase
MGSPLYGVKVLERVAEKFEIVAIYTQPDRPVGRKKRLTPTPVKVWGESRGVPVFTPPTLKGEGERIASFKPDFIVVASYGLILPKEILEIAPPINLHGSLLPKYRGASPIQSAILNGDKWTGVTAMLMEEGLDTGAMLGWSYTPIGEKTTPQLMEELGELGGELAVEVLERFEEIRPLPQLDALASYCKKITKADGAVTFKMPAVEIWRRYRAFIQWPTIFTPLFKIVEMELEEENGSYTPGEILKVDKREGSGAVGCSRGSVKLKKVQAPGRKPVPFLSYFNGLRLKVGDILPSKI